MSVVKEKLSERGFMKRVSVGGLVVGLALLATTCSKGAPSTSTPETPTTKAVVKMTDELRFDPDKVTLKVGETVTWQNAGTVAHTVTSDPGKASDKSHGVVPAGADPWDSGLIEGGKSFEHSFDSPGEFKYFCIPHEGTGMLGTIVVEE